MHSAYVASHSDDDEVSRSVTGIQCTCDNHFDAWYLRLPQLLQWLHDGGCMQALHCGVGCHGR